MPCKCLLLHAAGRNLSMSSPPLPRWDVSALFPALDSREFAAAHEGLLADVQRLTARYDERGVRGGPDAGELTASGLAAVVDETNAVLEQVRRLGSFLYSFIATDAGNDEAAALHSQFQQETAALGKLTKR